MDSSQPQQDSKELSSELDLLRKKAVESKRKAFELEEKDFEEEGKDFEEEIKAFELKRKELIQEALDAYKKIYELIKDPDYNKLENMDEEMLKSGELEYGLAFLLLDFGDLEGAEACWQEALKSGKENRDKEYQLHCLGRLCFLDICYFKEVETGKLVAEELVKECPNWLFFALLEALAQPKEEDFKEKLESLSTALIMSEGRRHLKVLKRDYERAKRMRKRGVDEEHWKKIGSRYRDIIRKIESLIPKESFRKSKRPY